MIQNNSDMNQEWNFIFESSVLFVLALFQLELFTINSQQILEFCPQTFSNRDRGFGFLKAWGWDRAQNYRELGGKK